MGKIRLVSVLFGISPRIWNGLRTYTEVPLYIYTHILDTTNTLVNEKSWNTVKGKRIVCKHANADDNNGIRIRNSLISDVYSLAYTPNPK
jgi:hypothetical protein